MLALMTGLPVTTQPSPPKNLASWRRTSGLTGVLRSESLLPISKSQPFLPRQHAVNPALFFRGRRIQSGQCLRQPPKARVAAGTVFDEKAFHGFAATGGEQNHALVD